VTIMFQLTLLWRPVENVHSKTPIK